MNTPKIKVGQKYRVVDSREFGYSHVRDGDVFTVQYIDEIGYGYLTTHVFMVGDEISSGVVELVEDISEPTAESYEDTPVFSVGQVWEILKPYNENIHVGDKVWVASVDTDFGGEEATAFKELTKENSCLLFEYDIGKGRIKKIADSLSEYFHTEPTADTQDLPSMSGQDDAEKLSEGSVGSPIVGSGDYTAKHIDILNSTGGVSAEILYQFIEGSGKYNQHNQLELKEMSLEQLKDVVRILEQYIENHVDTTASCLDIRLMYNGDSIGGWGASVHQLNYWSADEHLSGHLDKLLFSVECVRF